MALEAPPGPVIVLTDEPRLEQVLPHLLDNAARFSDGPLNIDGQTSLVSGHTRVAVRGRGIGVPHDARQWLFAPFEQLVHQGRSLPRGTGLGLPLDRAIMRALGGDLAHGTPEDGGSRFLVDHPVGELPTDHQR